MSYSSTSQFFYAILTFVMINRPKNCNLNVKKERKKLNLNLQSSNLKSGTLPTKLIRLDMRKGTKKIIVVHASIVMKNQSNNLSLIRPATVLPHVVTLTLIYLTSTF